MEERNASLTQSSMTKTTRRPLGFTRSLAALLAASTLLPLVVGCGPTKEEMQAQIDKYNQLSAENQKEKDERAKAEAELADVQKRVEYLKKKLESMGMNLDALESQAAADATEKERLSQNLEQLQAALDEYKARAAQLEKIQARFVELQKKLQKLVNLGLKVEVRHNRMVIRLPGDVLFDSGKTTLKDAGKEVIGAVADVIRKDDGLASRYFQIAGHTDDKPLSAGSALKDNWGLSAMRAREVMIFLVEPTEKGGGGLDQSKLHPAGYGAIDPVANNGTPEGRQQNRRVELVVLPDVSEMLDLTSMAQNEPAKPAATTPAKSDAKPAATTPAKSDAKPAAPAAAPAKP